MLQLNNLDINLRLLLHLIFYLGKVYQCFSKFLKPRCKFQMALRTPLPRQILRLYQLRSPSRFQNGLISLHLIVSQRKSALQSRKCHWQNNPSLNRRNSTYDSAQNCCREKIASKSYSSLRNQGEPKPMLDIIEISSHCINGSFKNSSALPQYNNWGTSKNY